MNNKGQMMVMESMLFAITVCIALFFMVQLAPATLQSKVEPTNDLQSIGDEVLHAIYSEKVDIETGGALDPNITTNNLTSKLVVYIVCDRYDELSNSLRAYLPDNIFYNLYISNGIKTKFICSTVGAEKLPTIDPVVISHFTVAIDPAHLTVYDGMYLIGNTESDIKLFFSGYEQVMYDVILEIWRA